MSDQRAAVQHLLDLLRVRAKVLKGWMTLPYLLEEVRNARVLVVGDGVGIAERHQVRAELWLWRRRQAAACLKRGLSRPKLVFPSTVGTPLDYNNVHKEFVAVVRKAELRHRSPHAMRHTFISLLLQKGASPAYVQKQAGHKSMDLTLNVYGHFVPGGNRQLVDLLDGQEDSGHSRRTA